MTGKTNNLMPIQRQLLYIIYQQLRDSVVIKHPLQRNKVIMHGITCLQLHGRLCVAKAGGYALLMHLFVACQQLQGALHLSYFPRHF
jgi:ABC-type transporter Mla MlaB component